MIKLFCKHKYKMIERLQYFVDKDEHFLTFLECEKCSKRKYVYATIKPYAITEIADGWVNGEYDIETLYKFFGK